MLQYPNENVIENISSQKCILENNTF